MRRSSSRGGGRGGAGARFAILLALAACAGPRVDLRSNPHRSAPPSAARSPGSAPQVPAVAELTLVLQTELGTDGTLPGDRFEARVRDEVRAPDGGVWIAAGARAEGTVARVRRRRPPLLALDVETVATTSGDARVKARLKGAEPLSLPVLDERYEPDRAPYDALFTPAYTPGPIGYSAPPAATGQRDYFDATTDTLTLPVGAELRFEVLSLTPAP